MHVAGKAIYEIILAAMGLIRDDDDISPIRKLWIDRAFQVWQELLNGCENYAAGRNPKQFLQVLAGFRLHWCLSHKILT